MLGLRSATIALVTLTSVWLDSTSATADTQCPEGSELSADLGFICIPVTDPGSESQPVGDDQAGGGGSGGPTECRSSGVVIPCQYAGGNWNSVRKCYLVPTTQPPPESDVWAGHDPGEGRIYACVKPGAAGNPDLVYVPDGEATPPDPARLARQALDRLDLTVPSIRMAPAPPAMTYVGLETWLWMPESQWATLKKSVTAGGTTVTVTAEPRRAKWDMGAGATTCHDAGREWIVGQMGDRASTNCGYTYQRVSDFQPNKRFQVTSTITFRATWTCIGDCLADEGSLGEVDGLPGRSTIQVSERQSVNVASKER